jgi:hypothetical protein
MAESLKERLASKRLLQAFVSLSLKWAPYIKGIFDANIIWSPREMNFVPGEKSVSSPTKELIDPRTAPRSA